MDAQMTWGIRVGDSESDPEMMVVGSTTYGNRFIANSNFWEAIPSEVLDQQLQGNTYIDLPIMAEVVVDGTPLRGFKTLRITDTPSGKNPAIQSVTLLDDQGGSTILTPSGGQTITFKRSEYIPENFACTATMATLNPGDNLKLIYRWSASASKTSDGELWVNHKKSDIESVLGKNVKAAEYRDTVLFSTKGEEGDDPVQYGEYEVSLVVRDKNEESAGREEDRFGVDFMTFTVLILDQ